MSKLYPCYINDGYGLNVSYWNKSQVNKKTEVAHFYLYIHYLLCSCNIYWTFFEIYLNVL